MRTTSDDPWGFRIVVRISALLARALILFSFISFSACRHVSKNDVPRLIKQLRASDSHLRNQAAMELGSLGEEAKTAVPALIQTLSDSNGGVRSSAAFALRKIDTPEAKRALDNYKQ